MLLCFLQQNHLRVDGSGDGESVFVDDVRFAGDVVFNGFTTFSTQPVFISDFSAQQIATDALLVRQNGEPVQPTVPTRSSV